MRVSFFALGLLAAAMLTMPSRADEPSSDASLVPEPPAAVDTAPATPGATTDESPAIEPTDTPELAWHTDYREAFRQAKAEGKLLLIYFQEGPENPARKTFENRTLSDAKVRQLLSSYVLAKLPMDATVTVDGQEVTLLKHPAFSEMLGRQGIAIIDMAHENMEYYGYVVSTFPFNPGYYYQAYALAVILELPPGTLTQRTMIYAVRIHPEAPESTKGQFNPILADEAKQASVYQASITLQGHHSWDARFQRINAELNNGMMAQEVVAESWPNEDLVVACEDCVHSWRQSPGHWGAVRARQPIFGYDIKRGRNGIWYATGIFGRR